MRRLQKNERDALREAIGVIGLKRSKELIYSEGPDETEEETRVIEALYRAIDRHGNASRRDALHFIRETQEMRAWRSPEDSRIVVIISGGLVQDVCYGDGVPEGVTVEVRDYDQESCTEEELAELDVDEEGERFHASEWAH